jgi:hypothetical protein
MLDRACIGLTMVALLWPLRGDSQGVDDASHSQDNSEVLDLRTDGQPTPLVIGGDPLKRRVTSLEIRGKLATGGSGKGTVTLDESALTFNDFGDAMKPKAQPAKPCQVVFMKVPLYEKNDAYFVKIKPGENRRLYEIVFDDGSFPKRMYLVLSAGTTGPHRLLIGGGDQPAPKGWFDPGHILDLHGLPEITAPVRDAPLGDNFYLRTLSSAHGDAKSGLKYVTFQRTTKGPASLRLDPNGMGFNILGDPVYTTLIGMEPDSFPVTLKRIEIPDPTPQGRILLEVVVTKPYRLESGYFLVLSPTRAGSHRLLIRNGDTLRHVLPLR